MGFRATMLFGALLTTGCVTTGTYDAKVTELQGLRAQDGQAAAEKVAALESKLQAVEARLAQVTAERDGLRKSLDDSTALVSELTRRLEKLGQNVEKLTSERGQLSGALDDAKGRLEELRKQKAAAEALASTFRTLVEKLKAMIDTGKLKVIIRDGRMLIALPNDVLFDSGRTAVKPDAQAALTQVAQVLASIPDRRFLVAGHTDNVPIHTERFPSNWDLSAGRALEVTRFLISQGMKPQTVAAAGFGEFDPVASNDSAESRALNRRIEIVLQPNLAELPSLQGLLATPAR
jgi:chemotaxis protein MotB